MTGSSKLRDKDKTMFKHPPEYQYNVPIDVSWREHDNNGVQLMTPDVMNTNNQNNNNNNTNNNNMTNNNNNNDNAGIYMYNYTSPYGPMYSGSSGPGTTTGTMTDSNTPVQTSLMPPQFAMMPQQHPMVKKEECVEYRLSSVPSAEKSSLSSSNSPHNMETHNRNNKKEFTISAERDKLPDESLTEEELKARKKAQNRAAQKAFRERKEARLRELESKLGQIEQNRNALVQELDDLRKLNMEINAQNRILLRRGDTVYKIDSADVAENGTFSFPSEDEFFAQVVLGKYGTDGQKHPVVLDDLQNLLITVPKTWEYLYKLSEEKQFDVLMVMKRLKGKEVIHIHGPAYYKSTVDALIDETCNES